MTSSDENKDRPRFMEKTCIQLIQRITHVNSTGGVSEIDKVYKHAICECVNRLGYIVEVEPLGFSERSQRAWSDLSAVTATTNPYVDLSRIWADLPGATQALLEMAVKERSG